MKILYIYLYISFIAVFVLLFPPRTCLPNKNRSCQEAKHQFYEHIFHQRVCCYTVRITLMLPFDSPSIPILWLVSSPTSTALLLLWCSSHRPHWSSCANTVPSTACCHYVMKRFAGRTINTMKEDKTNTTTFFSMMIVMVLVVVSRRRLFYDWYVEEILLITHGKGQIKRC